MAAYRKRMDTTPLNIMDLAITAICSCYCKWPCKTSLIASKHLESPTVAITAAAPADRERRAANSRITRSANPVVAQPQKKIFLKAERPVRIGCLHRTELEIR